MTYVIAEPCIAVKDRACIEECPADCIYEGERMPYIRPANARPPARPGHLLRRRGARAVGQSTAEKARSSGQPGSPDGAKAGPLPHDTDYVASYFTGG